MAEQRQEEAEEVYVEHQYMCSECHQLFNTLEDVLIHQQIHTGQEAEAEPGEDSALQPMEQSQQYQCLECGGILMNADELLQHQEMHMQEAGMEVEQQVCEITETASADAQVPGSVQYQCLDCLALFHTPELWLEHRRTHSRSSTHSNTESTEYVLQPDGSVTPLHNTHNYVLSEQQAGEILAQVLAQQQKKKRSVSKSVAPSRSFILPPVTPTPGSATMHLQILTAQALADNSPTLQQRRSKLPPLVSRGSRENGTQRLEVGRSQHQQPAEVLLLHPYECSECSLLFQTPEDFLQHQGEHFLGQDKESGEPGVMSGLDDTHISDRVEDGRIRVGDRKAAWARTLQCELCSRVFTSVNRLSAHKRVHEHGTHECPDCGKVFKKAASLETHMRTHSGVARYLCVDCGSGFTTEMTLIVHRKQHVADPLQKCQFCNKTFTNTTKYLYHRRTHLNRDSSESTAPASMVSRPRKASATTLAILQRVRAKRSLQNGSDVNALASPSEEETNKAANSLGDSLQSVGAGRAPGEEVEPSSQEKMLEISEVKGGVATIACVSDSTSAAVASTSCSGVFSCRSCPKMFPSQLQLTHHRLKAHAAERSFACGICGQSFKKQLNLRNHLRTHSGEKPFQCSDCGKTFSLLANLTRHTLIHSGVRPYRCDICHRSFSVASNLRQHSLLHSGAAALTCSDCPATFRTATKLAVHRFSKHPGAPAPFPCSHCAAGFLSRKQRDKHCLEQHPTPEQAEKTQPQPSTSAAEMFATKGGLSCNICGKKLNSSANLRLHRLSHFSPGAGRTSCVSGKRPKAHQCPVCGKLFVSSSGVALHQRVHTGERPFPCPVCGKRFRQNTHLREHLRTHTGERPFKCEVCGKAFVQSMHLAEHRRTHTGERPHACPVCGKAFKTFSNLRNHKMTHERQQRLDQEAAATHAAMGTNSAAAEVAAVDLTHNQTQIIQIQTSDLQQCFTPQTHGTPTIMCNEFGETIAIIETSEGGALPLEQALEIYHKALENGLAVEGLQLL